MKIKYIQSRPSSKGLVCDIPLTGGFVNGVTIDDESGNGFDGTASGGTGTPLPVYPGFDFVATSTQYIDIGTGPSSVKTASLWVKQDDVAGTEGLLDLNGTDKILSSAGVVIIIGFVTAILYVDGVLGSSGVTTITTGWHHIVTTASGVKNADNFDIGRVGVAYTDALIADVRLYDYTLSAEEVASIYFLQRHKYQA